MSKTILHKNYLIYGSSILASRGLEYFVLFFAAHYLTKNDYGEIEYYKKLVEVVSSILAFGFPILILSYTRSRESKIYFYLLSILFVTALSLASICIGFFYDEWLFFLPALMFFSLFFTGGIVQSYQLVQNGSNYASIYKICVAFLFYIILFILIYYFDVKGEAFIYPSYILLPLALIFSFFDLSRIKIELAKTKKYWKLFKKLLGNSFTLVISNFSAMMFLYIDILVIMFLSKSPNTEIADFSFALNMASILLLVATTLVQVDVEKLKIIPGYLNVLNKKIIVLTFILAFFLILTYYCLINSVYFIQYQETFFLFILILIGKIFASFSNLFGTSLAIMKKFTTNLYINIIMMALNLVVCSIIYLYYGLIGIAFSGTIMLAIRYSLFKFYSEKFYHKRNINFD